MTFLGLNVIFIEFSFDSFNIYLTSTPGILLYTIFSNIFIDSVNFKDTYSNYFTNCIGGISNKFELINSNFHNSTFLELSDEVIIDDTNLRYSYGGIINIKSSSI